MPRRLAGTEGHRPRRAGSHASSFDPSGPTPDGRAGPVYGPAGRRRSGCLDDGDDDVRSELVPLVISFARRNAALEGSPDPPGSGWETKYRIPEPSLFEPEADLAG